jgi:hypothetical protein
MEITKEMLEELYTPSKKEQVAKVMHWVEHDLVDFKGILQICLDLMSSEEVDDLVALIEPELEEDEDEEEDMSWYLEELLEKMESSTTKPTKNTAFPETFGGFQF